MKWIIIYLLSLSSICKVDSQAKYFGATGTYIISAICKDGIVSGSDGMVRFYFESPKTGKKIEVGYFNNGVKSIRVKNLVVQTAGEDFFDELSVYGLLKKLELHYDSSSFNIDNFIPLLLKFSKNILSKRGYHAIISNKWIVSGYKGNRPCVIYYDLLANEISKINEPDYKNNAPNHFNDFIPILKQNDTYHTSNLIWNLIMQVSKKDFKTVGGNILIYTNSQSNIHCSCPKNNVLWKDIFEFKDAYNSKKIVMTFYSQDDKELFEEFLKTI
jgi:hypothetical protein